MSYTTPQQNPPKPNTTPPITTAAIVGYVLPVLTLVGLFILMGVGKLQTDVGIPLIAGIVGVHGGVAVANTSSNG